jgi:predicted RNA-binding Zn ribbon-like protein
LDFVNTEAVGSDGQTLDLLRDFGDLTSWLSEARLLTSEEARAAQGRWRNKAEGKGAFEQAVALRARLRAGVKQLVSKGPVPEETLEDLNRILGKGAPAHEIVRKGRHYHLEMRREVREAEDVLLPIAEAAADLLCRSDLRLIKKCQNPACVLYFLDVSKNHARRWCSMAVCGNRSKVAAHYRRHSDPS